MDTQALATAYNMMEEEVAALEAFLSADRAEDYPAYKFVVGQIRGLKTAMGINKDLAGNMEAAHEQAA